jgi:hypothetical protein
MIKDEVREEFEMESFEDLRKRYGDISYDDKIDVEFKTRTKVEDLKAQQK